MAHVARVQVSKWNQRVQLGISGTDRAFLFGTDVDIYIDQKYGSKDWTPSISYGSTSDKSVSFAKQTITTLSLAVRIADHMAWLADRINPDDDPETFERELERFICNTLEVGVIG